ncbi:hypothetical protein CL684_00195 [Candidatus Campbellbacteria bacterium]|nr:hypothetical protein [Candidatus Campbellbacteria bacterium]|tara:strand:- start:1276 stop:1527 length:252 start_codon:yes stop_codon:yes gene_type:complete
MKKHRPFIITIGWLGTLALFSAYILNIFGFIPSTGFGYAFINLIAALLLGIRVYVDKNWSNVVLEVFFGLVAIVSLIRYFFFS